VIADAAMAGLPTTEGRESQEAGVEPGPGSVGIEVLRRERLQGRPVPGDAQKAAEELPSA
jgi:hypothetical protein